MLRCIKGLFSFARSQNYLPEERATATDHVRVIRVKGGDVSVFTPKEMAKTNGLQAEIRTQHEPGDLVVLVDTAHAVILVLAEVLLKGRPAQTQ